MKTDNDSFNRLLTKVEELLGCTIEEAEEGARTDTDIGDCWYRAGVILGYHN
jgi:hypothetical protein